LKKARLLASLGAAGALALGGLAISAAPAFAASSTMNGTTHCSLSDPTCSSNLGPILQGPPPPGVTLPANCPAFLSSDAWNLVFTDGNSVSHGTINKNGDWGGGTATGTAQLVDSHGVAQYTGQATEWGGGGQNSNPGGDPTQQSENGFTTHFHGTGPAGSIDIHVNGHMTTNNAHVPTANQLNVNVTCS
jgi:hypothetical protein